MSLSLRAYSERSRAADGRGVRRKFRETISMTSVVINGRFECRSEVNRETENGENLGGMPRV